MTMYKLFFFQFLILWSCSSSKNNNDTALKSQQQIIENIKNMKFDDYPELWKQVQSYEKKGLTKSAFEMVQKIYQQAKKDNNGPQIIKALLYQSKYMMTLEEDSQLKIIHNFEREIAGNQPPVSNILENYLAQLYWRYYQNNRWQFAKRSETTAVVDPEDFRTWDLKTLFKQVSVHFDRSLQNKEILQQLPVDQWEDILQPHPETRKYRPTLYDLLLNEALDFYTTSENALTSPAYKFTIDDPAYLSGVEDFVQLSIQTSDSISLEAKALLLYQDWLRFRLKDKHTDALAMADLQRINYVYKKAVFPDKDVVYRRALQDFARYYKQSDVSALAYYYEAVLLKSQGDQYRETQDENLRWKKKEALEIARQAVEQYPDSRGAKLAQNLMEEIKARALSVKVEKNIPEQQPALMKILYKNISKASVFIYQTTFEKAYEIRRKYQGNQQLKLIEELPLLKSYPVDFTDPQDYQEHSTEKVLEALPNAYYVVVVKAENDNQWGAGFFQVTDVSLQRTVIAGKPTVFMVLDRNDGHSIDAEIEIKKWDRRHQIVPVKNTVAKDGSFSFGTPRRFYENYLFIVKYAGDKKAYFTDRMYQLSVYNNRRPVKQAFIFTDRSIYRPGQEVYFKTIVLEKQENRSEVLAGVRLTAYLYDVNRQKIQELSLKTNDYGSASGVFQIPAQTLTGRFNIVIKSEEIQLHNSSTIQVEEYKRPKFEVELKKPEKSFKINEEVQITGIAQSFAGTRISDARVTYRVRRKVEMPRWWYWFRPSGFKSEAQEIAHGQLKTGKDGSFIINFKALPDLTVKPEDRPVFHYEVYAEVTDINGETHSATTTVNIGYHSLLANMELPARWVAGQTDTLKISTTNLNGVEVPAQGNVDIYKLKSPLRVLRNRPWPEPDLPAINRQAFIDKFPHIPYDKTEADFRYWPTGKKAVSKNFDTGKSKELLIEITRWNPGKYVAVLHTRDKDGKEVTDKIYFDVVVDRPVQVPDQRYFDAYLLQKNYQPGEKVRFMVGSAAQGPYMRIWVEKAHEIVNRQTWRADGYYHELSVPVQEADRGGFMLHYAYYAYNGYVAGKQYVKVPFPSKELQIETLTFRDKLLPGQKEQWRFKIKGPKGEKVTAELLASMYDASLDALKSHQWRFDPVNYIYYRSAVKVDIVNSYGIESFGLRNLNSREFYYVPRLAFDRLNWFGFDFGINRRDLIFYSRVESGMVQPSVNVKGVAARKADDRAVSGIKEQPAEEKTEEKMEEKSELQVAARKNLRETAFFYPQLYTDHDGNVIFSFTMPEALTKWKLQLLAHTPKADYAYKELLTQTQKDLMVFPNAPRFVRVGDRLILSTKISNLTDKNLQGTAELQLVDAVSQQNVTSRLIQGSRQQSFSLDAGGNSQVSWVIDIPEDLQAIQYKVMAQAGQQTDAEQNVMPVLSNRMLVTETMPMWVRNNQSKTFVMDKLLHNKSKTLKNHRLTLEITSNPAWYAVQALPYLMEYPYECSEQTFARYYANALATHIVRQNPKIKQVFEVWKNLDTDALLSNLEKNQDLKSLIIEETPWLRDAQSESEQKKRIALLFDLNKMSYELNLSLQKLQNMQLSDGGFTWFKGGRYSNRYITQHIVAGMGHLKHLKVEVADKNTAPMLKKALKYLDVQIQKDYERLLEMAQNQKDKEAFLENYKPGAFQIHYLYARSFFKDVPMAEETKKARDFYLKQAQKYWLDYHLYTQGLLALISHRNGDEQVAKDIIRSLDENSIKSDELGMYWKSNVAGWYWNQAPIETQALLIEAFDEIDGDIQKIDEMRIWLLKNKQTNAWKTTKQTTEAVYALLLRGTAWLSLENEVKVKIGDITINPARMPEIKTEAGTGYFKKSWPAEKIKPEMAQVTITKTGEGIAWGALYWQYFEDLDRITNAQTPVAITKDLFIRRFTDTGEKIEKVTPETVIKVGDLVRVRVEIKVDRDMEYVHLKDMRASGFEPLNVLSGYRWQDGLGYYESTRDASTNFFISHLRKGVYVFEYDLRANNAGSFPNGITTLQCMYAPEFSSHSKGIHVNIEP